MAIDFEIRPLAAGRDVGEDAGGAEVLGFDFGTGDDPIRTRAWHDALDAHQLLVFRDAKLDADRQVAFLETLGPALIENESGRRHQFVSNVHEAGILGDERFAFHSDHAFMPDPIEVIALYGLEVPTAGTWTRFVNGVRAARALDPALRARVADRLARHIIDPAAASGDVAVHGPRRADENPHSLHPILWQGSRAGEPVLYVSEQQTDRVEGLPEAESRALIEDLFAHLYSGRFEIGHDWHEGDLVVWDNRALQHARAAIPEGARRTLRRVSVGGTPVYEYFRRVAKWGLD